MQNLQLRLTAAIVACLVSHHGVAADSGEQLARQVEKMRVWTNKAGTQQAEAMFVRVDDGIAYFVGKNGKPFRCELERLSDVDVALISQDAALSPSNQSTRFVAHQPAEEEEPEKVKIFGTVSGSDLPNPPTLEGVIVIARDEGNEFLGIAAPTKKDGKYEVNILATDSTVLLEFMAPTGYATGFDRLLKGDAGQEINKVLKSGPGNGYSRQAASAGAAAAPSASPAQKPDQKPDQPAPNQEEEGDGEEPVSLNGALKDSLDKLLVFEALYAQQMLVDELDSHDTKLRENISNYIRGMDRPLLRSGSDYNTDLYRAAQVKYDAIARLYGVYEEPVIYYQPSHQHHRRIFPLFRRRR